MASTSSIGDKVGCPECGEPIQKSAKICPHCKSDLSWKRHVTRTNAVLAAVVALAAGGLALWPQVEKFSETGINAALIGEDLDKRTIKVLVATPGAKSGSLRSALVVMPFTSDGKGLRFVTMYYPPEPVLLVPGARQQVDLNWRKLGTHIQGTNVESRSPTTADKVLLRSLLKDWKKADCEFGTDVVTETGSEPIPQHAFRCSKVSGILELALDQE